MRTTHKTSFDQRGAPLMQRGKQIGFTLIEVLVALVIVSVGMLGIAGLYVHGMQAGRTAMFSHQAVTLAGDVADRIRANPRAGAAYAVAGAGTDNGCVAGVVNCDVDQMAANDIFVWAQQAQNSLPNGQVEVQHNAATNPPEYTITIRWTEAGENGAYAMTIPVLGI